MNEKQQRYMLEKLLSSSDIFAICTSIIKPTYFDPTLRPCVEFIKQYYDAYHDTPLFDDINARFSLNLSKKELPQSAIKATCDEIEEFCKDSALVEAVIQSMDHINNKERGKIRAEIDAAMSISLQKDLGLDMFRDDIRVFLESCIDTQKPFTTGIKALDDLLGLGLMRKTLTMFSAMSGGGKSVMMTNLGVNYAKMGLNAVYISLELSKEMVGLRSASIITGIGTKVWKENKEEIVKQIEKYSINGAGSFVIKRMPNGSCANDIRAYLKQYEIETKRVPDVIIVDYLDIMMPNGGARGLSVSERDKASAEELVNILHDYDAIGITASQQNRESLRMSAPDQGVIAGGMTKVNTVDNYISLSIPEATRNEGIMYAHALKTRSSDGVGKTAVLNYNGVNLQIVDPNGAMRLAIGSLANRKQQIDDLKEHIKYEFSDGENFPEAGAFAGNESLLTLIEKINKEEDELKKIKTFETENVETRKDLKKAGSDNNDDVIVYKSEKVVKPIAVDHKKILKGLI